MNQEMFKSKWPALKAWAKEKWGQLTDDDLDRTDGSAEHLIAVLREKYGYAREQVEGDLNQFLARYSRSENGSTSPRRQRTRRSGNTDNKRPA
jgi:uncharacterized protein YjbJ (UPF0337 family)